MKEWFDYAVAVARGGRMFDGKCVYCQNARQMNERGMRSIWQLPHWDMSLKDVLKQHHGEIAAVCRKHRISLRWARVCETYYLGPGDGLYKPGHGRGPATCFVPSWFYGLYTMTDKTPVEHLDEVAAPFANNVDMQDAFTACFDIDWSMPLRAQTTNARTDFLRTHLPDIAARRLNGLKIR